MVNRLLRWQCVGFYAVPSTKYRVPVTTLEAISDLHHSKVLLQGISSACQLTLYATSTVLCMRTAFLLHSNFLRTFQLFALLTLSFRGSGCVQPLDATIDKVHAVPKAIRHIALRFLWQGEFKLPSDDFTNCQMRSRMVPHAALCYASGSGSGGPREQWACSIASSSHSPKFKPGGALGRDPCGCCQIDPYLWTQLDALLTCIWRIPRLYVHYGEDALNMRAQLG